MSAVCLNKAEESSEIVEQDVSLATTPYLKIIDRCRDDPRFDTFAKRLSFFQHEWESDREFAKRLGVALKTLQRWKYQGGLPLSDTAERVANKLDVALSWLWLGFCHKKEFFKSGFKLTIIPRVPYYIEEHTDGRVCVTGGAS